MAGIRWMTLWPEQSRSALSLIKAWDLVETGIGLGINLITKLGSVAQEQIAEKISGRQNPAYGQTAAETERQYQGEPGHGGGEPSEQKGNFCVVNRLPLFPGSDVHIPFSINNDSPLSAKKLHLHVEGPGAEHFGMPFGSGLFSVRPDNVVIAPMDFEKLILTGTIPADAPSGSYSGWIVISGDEEFRIPATLTVTKNRTILNVNSEHVNGKDLRCYNSRRWSRWKQYGDVFRSARRLRPFT